jgi:2',3'-cyclic-nucleotide 2'-phosphodiesterase / 3'-nucleotidase / 5'-nucleotidase
MKKKRFSKVTKLTAAALMFSTIVSPGIPYNVQAETTNTAILRILETTDLHSNVMAYDYYQDTDKDINYGLAKTATLIKQARAGVPDNNSMLFDAGDTIQGTPLADFVARGEHKLGPTDTHPIFEAMNHLEYDAGIVGNHEFNYGLDYLNDVLEEADHPTVNANIYIDDKDGDPTNDKNYFTPYEIIDKTIKDKEGNDVTIKVGVIGFAPPQIMQWDKDNLTGKVIAKDIVEQANKFIPEMKTAGADVIVAIAHSGCDIAEEGQELAENAIYDLTKVEGIDAMLFGHAHLNFPGDKSFDGKTGIDNVKGTINGTQAVEAGYWGNNLGVLDLALVQKDGKWVVDKANPDTKSVLMPVTATTAVDEEIVSKVAGYHQGTLDYVRGRIGETATPMHSFFSRVMDDPSVQIVNDAQIEYVNKWINNPVNGLEELKDIPVISAAAPFKGGRGGVGDFTNIQKGELTIKSAADLYLFNNTLKAIKLDGAKVKAWLEQSASQFKTITPNTEGNQELLDYDFRPYNYDVIDGIKYEIDVTKPVGQRIINFTMMDGTPVADDQEFIVATNNYRATGGGGFPIKGAEVVVDSPYENRALLMDYIKEQGVVNAKADNNWKVARVDGATLTFNSSPVALDYLDITPNVKDLGASATKEGYQTYLLDQNVHVQLLGINDFHGQLDYSSKVNDKPVGGIEYLSGYLKDREVTNSAETIMLHAGDAVGASRPVSALLQDEPTIRFLNEIGFDLGTLGNHEFDEGITEMMRLIDGGTHPATAEKYGKFEGADFPYVIANVVDEDTKEPILPPYEIKTVDGVDIGFIGVITTETPSIVTASGTAGVEFTDEVDAINKYTAELKAKGVKAIVVLAHNPGKSDFDGANATGDVIDFANVIDDEVDVIFGGHDHKYLNTTVDGKLLVQSYSYGTAFSDVDLTINPDTQDITAKIAEIVTTFQTPEFLDAEVKSQLDSYKAEVEPIIGELVGEAAIDITRTANEAGESALGNLIADGMLDATTADFAFMNAGGIRNDLAKGEITWGDLFSIQPFGNDLVTLTITGEQVRTLLNQQFSADRYRIMSIAGLKYTWSDERELGEKVVDIYLPNGSKIDPKAEYTVAVNNFMADGGDGYTILKEGTDRKVWSTDLEALVTYVKAQEKPISAAIEGRIMFAEDVVTPPVDVVTPPVDTETPANPGAEKDPIKAPGGKLPNTATNMYNFLLFGILIAGFGLTLVMRKRRLQE